MTVFPGGGLWIGRDNPIRDSTWTLVNIGVILTAGGARPGTMTVPAFRNRARIRSLPSISSPHAMPALVGVVLGLAIAHQTFEKEGGNPSPEPRRGRLTRRGHSTRRSRNERQHEEFMSAILWIPS